MPKKQPLAQEEQVSGQPAVHRILLVDDNHSAARAMQKLFEHDGYEVETADSGEAALATAQRGGFDAIILDIQLPDTNGYEIAYLLRNALNFRELLIALTGYYGQDEDKLMARQAGFDYYFTRPVLVADIEKLFIDHYSRRQ